MAAADGPIDLDGDARGLQLLTEVDVVRDPHALRVQIRKPRRLDGLEAATVDDGHGNADDDASKRDALGAEAAATTGAPIKAAPLPCPTGEACTVAAGESGAGAGGDWLSLWVVPLLLSWLFYTLMMRNEAK